MDSGNRWIIAHTQTEAQRVYAKYDPILSEIYGHGVDKTEHMGKEGGGERIDKFITNGLSKLMSITISGKDKEKE